MFAGELILGSFSIEITDKSTASTPRMGLHLSAAVSLDMASSPGGCKIEIQTFPSS